MKTILPLVLLAIGTTILEGCGSYSQAFINAEGRIVWCSSAGTGLEGSMVAYRSKSQCAEDMRKLGFVEVERAGVIGLKYYSDQRDTLAKVLQVARNSPADRSGMKPGDIITKVDGQPVSGPRDTEVLTFGKVNTGVAVTASRFGKEMLFYMVRQPYSQVFGTAENDEERDDAPPREAPTVYMYPVEGRRLVTVTLKDGTEFIGFLVGESEAKFYFAKERDARVPTSSLPKSSVASFRNKDE